MSRKDEKGGADSKAARFAEARDHNPRWLNTGRQVVSFDWPTYVLVLWSAWGIGLCMGAMIFA